MRKHILIIIISLIFTSCQSVTITPKPGIKSITQSLITPSVALSTVLTNTPTISPLQIVSLVPTNIPGCLNLPLSNKVEKPYSGILVLQSDIREENRFMDMRTGVEKTTNPNQNFLTSDLNVSPDRKWIAYLNEEKSQSNYQLVIRSADGQKSYIYSQNGEEWQDIAYWLNNETLVLWNHTPKLDSIVLFNPFTGNKRAMKNNYPDMLPDESVWKQFWPSTTIYSPSLDKMVYLNNGKDGFKLGDNTLTFLDLKNGQVITEINHFGYTHVFPLWKSDGNGFIFVKSNPGNDPPVVKDDLYFISIDGKNYQLTKLGENYQNIQISSYSLSPDGNSLAFTVLSTQDKDKKTAKWKNHLMVLNLLSLQLFDYCLPPSRFTPLIWSPDGHQLAFSEEIDNNGDNSRAMILDFIKEIAFVVDDHLHPVGWMDTK